MASNKSLRELRMSSAMSSLTINRTRSTLAPSLSTIDTRRMKKVSKCLAELENFRDEPQVKTELEKPR